MTITDRDFRLHDGTGNPHIEEGEPLLNAYTLAELCGISRDEATAEVKRQSDPLGQFTSFVVPPAWRRGAFELQARHGTNDFRELLTKIRAEAAR